MKISKDKLKRLIIKNTVLSEGLRYHLDNVSPLAENIYRPGSERFFSLICEARKWYNKGYLSLLEEDVELINSDLGEWDLYEGREVALDFPISEEADQILEAEYKGRKVKLNKPKRGGKKKFYVYVKVPKTGKIKKISFGAKGMTTGLRDPARRKSFKARHNCEDKKDKTKAGYWSCRIGRHPKVTGAPYTTWW